MPPEGAGERIDRWLGLVVPDLSRSRIQALMGEGHVTVDGKSVKQSHKTAAGEVVQVSVPDPVPVDRLVAESIPLQVIHEDRHIIVVNKPAGLVVHPGPGNRSGTLVNALLHHCGSLACIGGEQRPGIVHRLDKDTSGAIVAAKSDEAMQGLVRQFRAREVKKEYMAVVWGVPRPASGRIETLIGRHKTDRKKMAVRAEDGRQAVTLYESAETFGQATVMRVVIETGRMHQIRVHFAHIGHPVVGDKVYGRKKPGRIPEEAPRQMLHAHKISFVHPVTGRSMQFTAPVPADIMRLVRALRKEKLA